MIVVLKPLDELGYLGYGIAVDGTVWSRWNTRGRLTDQWRDRETILKPTKNSDRRSHSEEGRKSRYVRLKVGERQVEVLVAKLLLEAVWNRNVPGSKIRYANGRRDDCRLVNLIYDPHPALLSEIQSALKRHVKATEYGPSRRSNPPGFITVDIE